ncbi:MAG: hypothetical protein U5L09_19490 [Bacteroidales bacterium]|nr:hypothetical protein [Bacteroidales bacterium]
MFAFGIIVSPLPYAAVVVLYAFYVILVQFNDSHEQDFTEADQDQKQIVLESDQSEDSLQGAYRIFSDNDTDNDQAVRTESLTHRSVSYFDLHLFPGRSDKPSITEFAYDLFSRPPPAML